MFENFERTISPFSITLPHLAYPHSSTSSHFTLRVTYKPFRKPKLFTLLCDFLKNSPEMIKKWVVLLGVSKVVRIILHVEAQKTCTTWGNVTSILAAKLKWINIRRELLKEKMIVIEKCMCGVRVIGGNLSLPIMSFCLFKCSSGCHIWRDTRQLKHVQRTWTRMMSGSWSHVSVTKIHTKIFMPLMLLCLEFASYKP